MHSKLLGVFCLDLDPFLFLGSHVHLLGVFSFEKKSEKNDARL